MIKISIIMPVYNASNFLEKSIESVSKQTLKDLELICVDDGSTDDSCDVLNELSTKYSFIKVYKQENKGSGLARNLGIKKASGEYIAFLDADDEFYDADALERMYNANVQDAKMISANLLMIDNEDNIVDNFFYTKKDYMFFDEDLIIKPEEYGAPLSFYKSMFNRQFLIDNDIFFPNFRRGQDPPFLAKVLILIDKIQGVSVNLYGHHYRVGGGAEKKIDTHEKLKGYIQHFKMTCDILEEGGLKNLSDFYKIHFFRYLKRKEIINNLEVHDILVEIFGSDGKYFEGKCDDYNNFLTTQKLDKLHENPSEELYVQTKKEVYALKLYDNKKLSKYSLRKSFALLNSDSLEEYLESLNKIETIMLEGKNKNLTRKSNSVKRKNKKLKRKLKKSKKNNKALLSSFSWRITKPFRGFK